MQPCSACGATLTAGAAWCPQCFAAVAASSATAVVSPSVGAATWQGPARPAATLERPTRTTRWAKTDTTSGPVGRLLATLALLVPFVVMIVGGIADPFVWGGAVVWGVVIMPWGLRDVWKAGRLASA